MNRTMELASARAPVALHAVRTERFDGDEDSATLWYRIACPCGGRRGAILSEYLPSEMAGWEGFWADPIVFRCADCGRMWTLFDSARHGYDPVLGGCNGNKQRTGEEEEEELPCPACGGLKHGVVAAYRYDIDDLESLGEDGLRQTPDLFTSVGFELACAECGAKQWLGDWETA
jgi:hypothetical protein